MPTITLEKVSKFYKGDRRKEAAIEDANLTIQQGEFVFVIGSSGAGKSTLLNLITGEVKPDCGIVYLDGKDLQKIRRWDRGRVSKTFGQVWQDQGLVRKRTVEDNLELVARIAAPKLETDRQLRERIHKSLGIVGMAGTEKKFPVELSSGECRRIELARALINSPAILVLDGITSNLDDDNIWDIFQLLIEINRRGTTIIMATHASQYVNIMRRRVVTLVDGKVYGDEERGRYGIIMPSPRLYLEEPVKPAAGGESGREDAGLRRIFGFRRKTDLNRDKN